MPTYSDVCRRMLTLRETHNRFHEDYHGEVLAELLDDSAAKTGFEPYLGLHFPATDLPQTVLVP